MLEHLLPENKSVDLWSCPHLHRLVGKQPIPVSDVAAWAVAPSNKADFKLVIECVECADEASLVGPLP